MMGEYLLYYNGLLLGGIYDDRFLVKETKNNAKYNMVEEIPYPGATPMYLVEGIENPEITKELIVTTYQDLNKNG